MARLAASTRNTITPVNLGKCLRFAGTNGVVTIPDNAAYSQVTTGALTISAWINPAALVMPTPGSNGNYVHWMSKKDANQNEWAFRMYMTGNTEVPTRYNRISFYVYTNTGGEGAGAGFEHTVIPGQWIHVVGTVDGQYISIYKNGEFQGRTDWVAYPVVLTDQTAPIRIGGRTGDGFFQGSIDQVRIWNRVLTLSEIQSLFRSDTASATGLVGEWLMEEGSGTTLTDTSATANNGVISGAAAYGASMLRYRIPVSSVPFTAIGTSTNFNRTNSLPRRQAVRAMTNSIVLASTSSQFLDIADASQTGLNVADHDFMVGGWFKLIDNGNFQHLICKYSGGTLANSTSVTGWELMYRGDQAGKSLNFRFNDGTSTGSTASVTDKNYADGKWHHIVAVVQRSADAVIYVDGIRRSETEQAMATEVGTFSSTGAFRIGKESGTGTQGFGNLFAREVFLYDLGLNGITDLPTLQATHIEPIYYQGVYNKSGLVSKWTLNNTLADSVGGNTLTNNGVAVFGTDVPIAQRQAA
jgi:hypothetical protein